MNGIKEAAMHLAAHGRHGDTMLVHMHPQELNMLEHLAGQPATINPHTGLPEAFSLWKAIVGGALLALAPFTGGLSAAIGLPLAAGTAAAVGTAGAALGAGLLSSSGNPSSTPQTAAQAEAAAAAQNKATIQNMVKIPQMQTMPAPYTPQQGAPGVIAEQPQPMSQRWNGQMITPGPNYGGFASGGDVPMAMGQDPANPAIGTPDEQKVVLMAIAAVRGKLPPDQAKQAVETFIAMFGEAEFDDMKREVSGVSATGGTEGMLQSPTSGMQDDIPATIGGKEPARLSGGEFVIPADVVAHLGDGNGQAGANELHGMMNRVRQMKTGKLKQPGRINPAKVLPA